MTTTLLLHLMLRHGADAMANAILDGCAQAAQSCIHAGSVAASRFATALSAASVTRIEGTATLRPVPVRAFRRA